MQLLLLLLSSFLCWPGIGDDNDDDDADVGVYDGISLYLSL